MIYTLTFNPAVDYVMYVDELKTGAISRAGRETVLFGGKGINVSLILKELGIKSTALGFTAGFTGAAIEEGICCDEIRTDFVRLKSGFSRINVKIREKKETDINGNGPEICGGDIDALFEKLDRIKEGDYLVMAGSVPKTLPGDIYEKIMERLHYKNIRFVIDAEKELLMNTLKYRPFLVKPNDDELGAIFGVEINTPENALIYARKLFEAGARNVLVSMGKMGAVLIDETGGEHYMEAFDGKAVNTVGAGDSMVAGFLAGYCEKKDYSYALRLGTASGSATAFCEGLADREKIFSLM